MWLSVMKHNDRTGPFIKLSSLSIWKQDFVTEKPQERKDTVPTHTPNTPSNTSLIKEKGSVQDFKQRKSLFPPLSREILNFYY